MNRITRKFQELRRNKKKAFIPFLTAGYPSLKFTEELVLNLAQAGVDVIELGIPFSDPLADGQTIQMASELALKKGVNVPQVLQLVRRVRQKSEVPIAFMTYCNTIVSYGEERFVKDVKVAGIDGLIIPDLPPEEAGSLRRYAQKAGLTLSFFVAPTTSSDRIRKIVQASTGFIYYVSLTGVTGARQALPSELMAGISEVKKVTDKAICVGFGISTSEQVKMLSYVADGVIVGSAIIKEIQKLQGQRDAVAKVTKFVSRLREAQK
ncbi:MAG: tryptophan synthase subunit alpha [Candidatus Omnitrophica bacterium]|nr:tryptophan synthase subunit alpha [Candidatus Omnitrophota bacterium]